MLQREHFAILSTLIELPIVIKNYVLYTLEWPFYTGFTVKLLKLSHITGQSVYKITNLGQFKPAC